MYFNANTEILHSLTNQQAILLYSLMLSFCIAHLTVCFMDEGKGKLGCLMHHFHCLAVILLKTTKQTKNKQ